jgi:pyruvate formate lyase activating enzyme
VWRSVSPEELYEELSIDSLYFLATGGGVTFGGGEPCLYGDFISAFRSLCGPQWRITLETCLNVPRQYLEKLLPVVDEFFVDIKDMNPQRYERYTRRSNSQVVENLLCLAKQGRAADVMVRVPLIPYYNTRANVDESLEQLRGMGFARFDVFRYVRSKKSNKR